MKSGFIKRFTRGSNIREKITNLVTLPICICLSGFGAIFLIIIWQVHHANMKSEQELRAKVIAQNLSAAADFNDTDDALDVLRSLALDGRLVGSAVLLADGKVLAAYPEAADIDTPVEYDTARSWSKSRRMHIVQPIPSSVPSSLYLELDTSSIYKRILTAGLIYLFGALLCSLLAILLVRRMRTSISEPFSALAQTVETVSNHSDFSVRATVFDRHDEIGQLAIRFNQMIKLIGQRDRTLAANITRLERANQEVRNAQEAEARLRDKLERAQRLESIGILAGGVAHDLNNLLGPVLGYPAMIRESHPDDQELCEDLNEIEQAAVQASSLIKDLLTLARRGAVRHVPVDVRSAIEEISTSSAIRARKEKRPDIEVKVDLPETLPAVMGSKSTMHQMLLNVCLNGINATESGTLSLSAEEVTFDTSHQGYELVPPGRYVSISVRDQGRGIPKEMLAKIFEPFFSTKKMGGNRGSGLGLAIVYSVTKDMNGYIDIVSKVDEGSLFRFFFPAIEQSVADGTEEEKRVSNLNGSENILVIDDLREQRQLMVRVLSGLGYTVQACASAEEGIGWLASNSCDLILLDMMLGDGLNGCEATDAILSKNPDQAILLVSGYAPGDLIKKALALGARCFISKPYTPKELASAVKGVLQSDDCPEKAGMAS